MSDDIFDTLTTESLFGLDIGFVIDSTGSMISYINGAKQSIKEIMNQSKMRFKKYKADDKMLNFGIVAYRDHPPQDTTFITKVHNFSDFSTASDFLDNLTASGGGDPPEAVLDGLNEAVNTLTWNDNTEKLLFLLLDNPGHGIRYGTYYDCPCDLHEKDILPAMKKKGISFYIIRPKEENSKLDKMIELFKEYIDIDTMELEKYKKKTLHVESGLDSDTEMKIFSRMKYKQRRKSENTKHLDTSEKDIAMNGGRERSRSRSRSLSKERKYKVESDKGILPKDYSRKETYLSGGYKDYKEYISIDCDDVLEKGISEIITNTVILKLDQQLKSLSTSNGMESDIK